MEWTAFWFIWTEWQVIILGILQFHWNLKPFPIPIAAITRKQIAGLNWTNRDFFWGITIIYLYIYYCTCGGYYICLLGFWSFGAKTLRGQLTKWVAVWQLKISANQKPHKCLSNSVFVSTALAQVDALLWCGVKK